MFCFQTLLLMLINSTLFLDPAFCHSTLVLIISSVLWALLWSYKLHVLSLWTFFSPSSCLRTDAKLRSFYYNIPVLGSAPPSQANIVGLLQRSNSTAFSIKKNWNKVLYLQRQIVRMAFQPYACKRVFSRGPAGDVDCQETTELCPNMTHGLSD